MLKLGPGPEPFIGDVCRRLRPSEKLYVRSMGKALAVTAVFTSDEDANAHMRRHPDDAVVACFGPLILCARKYDKGVKIDD